MTFLAHNEPTNRRGNIQTLAYLIRQVGMVVINLVIILALSGPSANCPGYESNPDTPCTTDPSVTSRNNLSEQYPDEWCHMQCSQATFDFGLEINQYIWLLVAIGLVSLPFYFMLKEDKKEVKDSVTQIISNFWKTAKRQAVWRVILYTIVSNILFNVSVACQQNANYVFMGLTTMQNQIINILEAIVFAIALYVIKQYCRDFSWRKMVLYGNLTVTSVNLLYLLIINDVCRNPWFYVAFSVSDYFMYTVNWMASLFAIVEVSETGFETVTYALITTSADATMSLSSVISNQLLSFFPSLATQASIATDTPLVRNDMTALFLIVTLVNTSALLVLPLLPRQREEAWKIMKEGVQSAFWGGFALISGLVFLVYSTIVTFLTVAGADTYGCMAILGGPGCGAGGGVDPGATTLLALIFLYCFFVFGCFVVRPIAKGEKKFSWGMYV